MKKKKKPQFPYLAKRGSAVVKVYESPFRKNGVEYSSYRLTWYDTQNIRRVSSFTG